MYALYQSGYSIYGVGDTLQDAVNDAAKWMDPALDGEDWQDRLCVCTEHSGRSDTLGALYARPCTGRLRDEVVNHGGDCAFVVNAEGVVDLATEEQE
jgi:hypothetical protein